MTDIHDYSMQQIRSQLKRQLLEELSLVPLGGFSEDFVAQLLVEYVCANSMFNSLAAFLDALINKPCYYISTLGISSDEHQLVNVATSLKSSVLQLTESINRAVDYA